MALALGFVLEFLSVSISTAGYFAMGSPLFFLLMFSDTIDKQSYGGLLPTALGVGISGLAGLARFIAPFPEDRHYTNLTRLNGFSLNVLRTTLVGLTMFGASKLNLGPLIIAGSGFLSWAVLNFVLINPVLFLSEDSEVSDIWRNIPMSARPVSYTHLTLPTTPYV